MFFSGMLLEESLVHVYDNMPEDIKELQKKEEVEKAIGSLHEALSKIVLDM
jgi:hypothetical protein